MDRRWKVHVGLGIASLFSVLCLASTSTVEYGSIQIQGDAEFVRCTVESLELLEEKAPEAYLKVSKYVGLIAQGERSGMWAYEDPPRYEVGEATWTYSVTWYASTIAHDATHSELYHEYLAAHPEEAVPTEAWAGRGSEVFCLSYQLEVLKAIGGPAHEVDYLAEQTGEHCDVDGDGDCDWEDYEKRDW